MASSSVAGSRWRSTTSKPDAALELADVLDADVARHEHDAAREVDRLSLAVGEHALVHELQEQVVDLLVRLLELVEQDHAGPLLLDGLGELAALVVPDVAGRRADELGVLVGQGVLAAVDAHEVREAAVEVARQRLGHLGLARARRPDHEEDADRLARVLEADRGLLDGLRDRAHGARLADDRAGQRVLDVEHALLQRLALGLEARGVLLGGARGRRALGGGAARTRAAAGSVTLWISRCGLTSMQIW
jgi:hypothetical protein